MALQYDYTVYDRVAANNGQGIGMGLTLLMAAKSNFKPKLEFTSDIFSGNDVCIQLLTAWSLRIKAEYLHSELAAFISLLKGYI
jgi:hypothetical protein